MAQSIFDFNRHYFHRLFDNNMRSFLLTTAITGAAAFTTTSSTLCRRSLILNLGKEGNVDFGGNA